ncbi:uncharacterized protein LOC113330794 isoform X2 [Papaver somniferum]|uniref:uncharacterized protein LOC113330794 isoform X2 n=1 Tax=Papaver somniferum TaxID=3469 RepID=UPI000E6FDE13|nr:uncharacterized protein LOC113330794 isoform X2 [Papaver somniferum]XP_026433394.1 uncharacterized protein LOC113330794 isoform X2 [Papaver somniferum]
MVLNMIDAGTEFRRMVLSLLYGKKLFYTLKCGCAPSVCISKLGSHDADAIYAPLNGREASFLIHGITKPLDEGVQKGDSLGPLIFALTLHAIVLKISQQCKLDLKAWYLDDGTIIGDTIIVSKAFHIIKSEGVSVGLDLNIHKIELFWPSFDESSTQVGVFPADIGRPSVGVELLGGPVSLDTSFCNQLVLDKVHKTTQLMDVVHRIHDPQSELLLLRNCAGGNSCPVIVQVMVCYNTGLSLYLYEMVS